MTETQILCQSHYTSLEKYFSGLETFLHILLQSKCQHLAHLFGILISQEDFEHTKKYKQLSDKSLKKSKEKKMSLLLRESI